MGAWETVDGSRGVVLNVGARSVVATGGMVGAETDNVVDRDKSNEDMSEVETREGDGTTGWRELTLTEAR